MSDVSDSAEQKDETPTEPEREVAAQDYRTLSNGQLSPRHRRLALLAAEGNSNQYIAENLGYSDSRVSILLKNPHVAAEVQRLQERIYEDTISTRLRGFTDTALNVIQSVLTDRTGRVKTREQTEVAMWVIEKLDGKAIQKLEAGTGLLAQLMERLDAKKTSVTQVNITNNNFGPESESRDVGEAPRALPAPPTKDEEDELADWFVDFDESRDT
jgi:hypothetical protein